MKSFWRKEAATALALLLTILICGCVVATEADHHRPRNLLPVRGDLQGRSLYGEKPAADGGGSPPSSDRSKSKKGFETVRRGFYNHFSSLPFKDMEITKIDDLLKKADLTDPEQIKKTSPQKLGEILGVDAVIYGEISNFDKLFAVIYSQVSVGAEVKMYETKTGQFLWSGQHVVRIHEGGFSTTPIGIIAVVIATAMNLRDIQLLRACDDLFREMVKTIPTPPLAAACSDRRRLPFSSRIRGTFRKRQGMRSVSSCRGRRRCAPRSQSGSSRSGSTCRNRKTRPGLTSGSTGSCRGTMSQVPLITGRLTDDAGNTAEWVGDALGTVTLSTQRRRRNLKGSEPSAGTSWFCSPGRNRMPRIWPGTASTGA